MKEINELTALLTLEKIEENIFRGKSFKTPWKRVFGGQVLAQALHAAHQTVETDRQLHSMHAYFILPGDVEAPIIYHVERLRDGGSFSTRRVVAIQHGKAIFNAAASFQLEQEGLDHQIPMPNVPPPDWLQSDEQLMEPLKKSNPAVFERLFYDRPIEFRPVEKIDPFNPKKSLPYRHVWLKANGTLPDDKTLHREILAYASDYNLLMAATLPHLDDISPLQLFIASLDHAMWFHRDFRVDEWLLYAIDSPSASGSRGFTRGNLFTRDGILVGSVVQEGLIRQMDKYPR